MLKKAKDFQMPKKLQYDPKKVTDMYGKFTAVAYENDIDRNQHVALVMGAWKPGQPVLVRVHSKCLTGDVFGSERCDCGQQLHRAMEMINEAGKGVISTYLERYIVQNEVMRDDLARYHQVDPRRVTVTGWPSGNPGSSDNSIIFPRITP